jgi:cellulose biosynthesis protein BcsQ
VTGPYLSLCIAHIKGGVGKTTTSIYLGRELSALRLRVIWRDLDPQKSLTGILRLFGSTFLEDGTALYQERLAMVPDGAHLPFLPHVEIIDTPPGLNDAWPAIQRADCLIIPVKPALQDILAVQEMLRLLADTRDRRPPSVVLGVLPTDWVARWPHQRESLEQLRCIGRDFGVPVLQPIPQRPWVGTFSMRGRLWRDVAHVVVDKVSEVAGYAG